MLITIEQYKIVDYLYDVYIDHFDYSKNYLGIIAREKPNSYYTYSDGSTAYLYFKTLEEAATQIFDTYKNYEGLCGDFQLEFKLDLKD